MSSLYLSCEDCIRLFADKQVYIFGTGIDAENATSSLKDKIKILAYVDNNRHGNNRFFNEKPVISVEQLISQRGANSVILIATNSYAKEITQQLCSNNLVPGIDFHVWDEMYVFHSDENIDRYIAFLKNVWGKCRREETNKKVLIPFYNRHEGEQVSYAHCANYFAAKYDAKIYGFMRFGAQRRNASEIIEDIYRAFNMEDIIDSVLSEEQKNKSVSICDELWKNLYTWEDWKNISVYGICFGTVIVSHFMRIYIPCFDLREQKMYDFLRKSIDTIVFWYQYFEQNEVCAVLMGDGVTWEGYIREIAVSKNIPTYEMRVRMRKLTHNYASRMEWQYYDKMWEQLTPEEQEYGRAWAKEHIARRLKGATEEVTYPDSKYYVFANGKKEYRVLEKNDKLKVLICPHVFEEDSTFCGEHIFDNNYFAWLCHLGELSEQTPNYDWYMKLHPNAQRRDFMIMNMLLEKYPKIKLVPADISPYQLKEEGIRFALTVQGSIGHEYPKLGIQVINAGMNPHSCFDFTWNPKTKSEYDELILHLNELEEKADEEGLYRFYCINYLYYNLNYIPFRSIFYQDQDWGLGRVQMEKVGKTQGTWMYKEYMEQWTAEQHEHIRMSMEGIFRKIDEWRPDILYRKNADE